MLCVQPQEIVTSATSDQDRINWLRLLLKDQYLTTDQGQDILDHLADAGLIGTGAMQKTEIFIAYAASVCFSSLLADVGVHGGLS